MPNRPEIRHVVLFSAKREDDIPKIIDGLSLLKSIEFCSFLEVRENLRADSLSNEIDVVVYAEFSSQETLNAFKAHPIYQEAINIVRPLRDLRFVADF